MQIVRAYVDSPEVAVSAIGCLWNLCREHYNSAMTVKQGGVKCLVDTMKGTTRSIIMVQDVLYSNPCHHGQRESWLCFTMLRPLPSSLCTGAALSFDGEVLRKAVKLMSLLSTQQSVNSVMECNICSCVP